MGEYAKFRGESIKIGTCESMYKPGELFRAMQREYGRCISKVYIDKKGGPVAIGWVFQGRDKYEDTDETYLREVWVTLRDAPDTVKREHHYHELPR